MSLERRFHLLVGLALGAGFIVFATLGYLKTKTEAEENLRTSADRVYSVLMATRRIYQHQFIDSGLPLNEKTLGFLPAHALNRISKDLANWDKTGFSFNNVSDRPRNPEQKADAIEMAAIEYFRGNPKKEVRFVPFSAPNGEPYYHYARPIWIEKYCLDCHGERAKAPETIRRLYDTGYDYQVGDLRGVLSIKIPAQDTQKQLLRGFLYTLAWTGSTLVLLWLIVGFVVRRDILRPLALLKNDITRLAGGTRSGRVGTLPGEFGDIGHEFDVMADSLEQERARLASSEERFRRLATTATDAIILADMDHRIQFWNEGAEHIFGYAQPDIIGKFITAIIPERFHETHSTVMERIRQGEAGKHLGHSIELSGLCRDGTEIPVELSLNAWVSEGKRYFVAIVRDIRSRKAAELAMAREHTRLETILRTASDGIHILDDNGLLIEANDAFLKMLGYDKTAIRRLHVTDWDAQGEWHFAREWNNARIDKKGTSVFETRHKRTDGKILDVEISACGIEIEGQRFLYAASRDITERKRADEELRASKAEAERANMDKSCFLAAASHDLRQPLSALSIYVDVLNGHVAPVGQPVLANMKDCIGSLSELLNDLLDLSKLDAGVVMPILSDFAIGDALASLVAVHTPEAQLKGLRLRCVGSHLTAHTDPVLFRRILGNFMANALRYTERGGVLVGCRRRQGKRWVEVWDTGIGIAADQTAKIFEEFYQLDRAAQNRGSGLGLAIATKTAALLGLEISVRSWLGRGSVFAVELPPGQGKAIPALEPRDIGYRSLRIALVEDHALVRQAFIHGLQDAGHQVVAAATGEELRNELGSLPPDIVISDYRLAHGETGFDVISAVRATMGTHLPAIIITGDTDPQLMRSMADRGVVVLHKPLDLGTVQAYLEDLTNQGRVS